MVLELSRTIKQSCGSKISDQKPSKNEMQSILSDLMRSCGLDQESLNVKNGEVIELKDSSDLKLHSLMLKAEEQGLDLKFTKKTVIEFC